MNNVVITGLIFICAVMLTSCDKSEKAQISSEAENTSALPLTEMTWYAPNNLTKECMQDEGPGKMIEMLQTLQKPYTTKDEEKVGETVTVVTIEMPSEGGAIRYLRGKDRCEAYVNAVKSLNEGEVNKYN
jgi:hypothetical protein